MTGSEGDSSFCFPRISVFPKVELRETLRFKGNKINWFPEGPDTKDFRRTAVIGQHLQVTLDRGHIFCNVANSETFGGKQFDC